MWQSSRSRHWLVLYLQEQDDITNIVLLPPPPPVPEGSFCFLRSCKNTTGAGFVFRHKLVASSFDVDSTQFTITGEGGGSGAWWRWEVMEGRLLAWIR